MIRGLGCLVLLCASGFAQAPALKPLPIALPKPLFEGTPEPANVPNLEKPSGKPRPPFLAPAGVTNVALHKAVWGAMRIRYRAVSICSPTATRRARMARLSS